MTQLYKNVNIENVAPSKLKIKMQIDGTKLSEMKDKILQDKAKNMVIPGFRKGEAPLELVKKQLGEQNLLEDAAKELAAQALAQVIIEKQLKVVGRPDIVLGEVKDDQDIDLEAYVVVLPEIKVKDSYKEALKKINAEPLKEAQITDDDVEKVIEHLRREKARILTLQAMQNKKPEEIQMPDFNTIPKDQLPNLDEQDYKELAGANNFDDFKKKVAENIKMEKDMATKEERRAKIAEELLKHIDVELPEEIVQMELQRAKAQMEQDLKMMGLTLDAYLAQIKKDKEEFEKEMYEASKKRAILQLALDKIAETEKISVNPKEVEQEVQHILSHNPQANPDEVRAFVDAQKSNEKVFDYLMRIK